MTILGNCIIDFSFFSGKLAEQKGNFCVCKKKVINVVLCLLRRPLSCSISRNYKSFYLSRLCSPDVWDAHEGKLLEVRQQLLPLLWWSRHHLYSVQLIAILFLY